MKRMDQSGPSQEARPSSVLFGSRDMELGRELVSYSKTFAEGPGGLGFILLAFSRDNL